MRAVRTRVFPLPAPAKMRSGPSPCVTASCCGGFKRASSASIWGWEVSEITRTGVYPGLETLHPPVRLVVPLSRELDLRVRDHLLYEVARDLSSSLDLDVVLRKVMDRVITLMRAARGFIVLVDPDTNIMSVQMSAGEADEEKARQFLGSRTVIEHVVRSGQAVVSTDASLDDRFKGQQSVIMQNLRSIIAVPLVTKSKVIGAVYVDNPFRAAIFEEEDKEFLQAISDLAAIAIDNARQYERSEFLRQVFEAHVNKQVTDYVQRMIRVVLDHGGNIDKFQGDGMLVVFGAPNPMHDHAERALNAAVDMVREIDNFNQELVDTGRSAIAVGMGLDTGEVVAGHVGSGDRMEFTLIGVPVNNSAYLSKIRPARVLMSETTRARVPDGFRVTDFEPMILKGAKRPQPIFELGISVPAD